MTVTPTNIIQSNEYYPFGLQTANSWTRDNNTANNFLANGGTELNATSQLYDLEFRNYDPILGRMHQVDPMAHKYSSLTPYNYSFNSPVVMNDRSGADPFFNRDAWRGALVNNSRLPMDHGTSGSLADYARTIYDDAEAVKNGTMSLEGYVGRYGSDPTGSDLAALASAMWGVNANAITNMTYGGTFSFKMNGKTYGGNFVVEKGAVTTLGFGFSMPSDKGGLLLMGDYNLIAVGADQNYNSALKGWIENIRQPDWADNAAHDSSGPIYLATFGLAIIVNTSMQLANEGIHSGYARNPKNNPLYPVRVDSRGNIVRQKIYGADAMIPTAELQQTGKDVLNTIFINGILNRIPLRCNWNERYRWCA